VNEVGRGNDERLPRRETVPPEQSLAPFGGRKSRLDLRSDQEPRPGVLQYEGTVGASQQRLEKMWTGQGGPPDVSARTDFCRIIYPRRR
jgi:hypothetical protein